MAYKKNLTKSFLKQRAYRNKIKVNKILTTYKVQGVDANYARQFLYGSKGYKGLTTKATTQRITKINKQLRDGTFNPNYYKDLRGKNNIKGNLSKNPHISIRDIFVSLNRTDFYYDNKELIKAYNKDPNDKSNKRKLKRNWHDYTADMEEQEYKSFVMGKK